MELKYKIWPRINISNVICSLYLFVPIVVLYHGPNLYHFTALITNKLETIFHFVDDCDDWDELV